MSDKWVSVRRRILTLPKKVQDAIARDAVPKTPEYQLGAARITL